MKALLIARVAPAEVDAVIQLFSQQVYPGHVEQAQDHFADHGQGGGDSFLASVDGQLAGYITIRWQSRNLEFRRRGIPLIHHLAVFPQFQRQGIGSQLMDTAERLIATRAAWAGITVGLFDAYGPAQRLYAQRGYMPDGRGACYGQRPLRQGELVRMDHELILWLVKDLSAMRQAAGQGA